jgi:ribosomal protein S18 acetylase RimI-like enzyme
MDLTIRAIAAPDEEQVVELSLRAWAPVFAESLAILGDEIFDRLHGDWREYQARAVRAQLSAAGVRAWVAEVGARVVGFVTVTIADADRRIGEVGMIAVDPDAQNLGTGLALTDFAVDRMVEDGMRVAMINTGGDAAHAPARRVYVKAGFTPLSIEYEFRAL